MDSFKSAVGYLVVYTPLRMLSKVIEGLGVVWGLLEHPFQTGKYNASKVYDKFK